MHRTAHKKLPANAMDYRVTSREKPAQQRVGCNYALLCKQTREIGACAARKPLLSYNICRNDGFRTRYPVPDRVFYAENKAMRPKKDTDETIRVAREIAQKKNIIVKNQILHLSTKIRNGFQYFSADLPLHACLSIGNITQQRPKF